MLRVIAVAIASIIGLSPSPSTALDLTLFWDNRCAECHGPAGAFARTHLHIEDGKLAGRHNRDLKRFLSLHETGAAESDGIYGLLLAQFQSATVYEQKYAGCHDGAAEFAKISLEKRDSFVLGRKRALPLSRILKRHGKLAPDEIPAVVEMLTRALDSGGTGPVR